MLPEFFWFFQGILEAYPLAWQSFGITKSKEDLVVGDFLRGNKKKIFLGMLQLSLWWTASHNIKFSDKKKYVLVSWSLKIY